MNHKIKSDEKKFSVCVISIVAVLVAANVRSQERNQILLGQRLRRTKIYTRLTRVSQLVCLKSVFFFFPSMFYVTGFPHTIDNVGKHFQQTNFDILKFS